MKKQPEISEMDKGSSDNFGFYKFVANQHTSSLKKYQDLMIGDYKLLNLIKFEFLTSFLTYFPGMLGMFLRQKFYRFLFKRQGKGVIIGSGVSLRQPAKITIESGSIIDDLVSLSIRGTDKAGIRIGENVFVGRGSILNARDGLIDIDNYTSIGSFCRIATAKGQLRIGRYVLVAAYCYIGGGNHRTDQINIPMALQDYENRGGVVIGDDVWIGAHTIITDGVKIGKGCIIGAGSFVNKDIPDYSIAFGCPAKVQRKRV
ncbi:MAG: DapH/DapD/GlmU-related protein [bacterium]